MTDLNHIVLFVKVVEAGSFSAAARALNLPKATVSRNVARLEADLGARLLHRTTRKLELTDLGRTYYHDAARGLGMVEEANRQVTTAQSVPSGTLRVAAPLALGSRSLMEWIAEFLATFDKVNLELVLSDEIIDLIAERIDVAFRVGRLENSSFIARKLGPARRILLANERYLQRRGVPDQVDDLQQHDCVIFGHSISNTVWRLDGPDGTRQVHVRGRIAVNGVQAALQATLAGIGIGLLPSSLTMQEVRSGRLRRVLADYSVDSGGLYAMYPSNRNMPAALRTFLDFVAARAGRLVDTDRQDSSPAA